MLGIVLRTRGTARNKSSACSHRASMLREVQPATPVLISTVYQQNSPKGGTHTTSEIWNCEGCTQINTIIVTIRVYDYILFMAHNTGFPFVLV